jgi:uncharacterized protein
MAMDAGHGRHRLDEGLREQASQFIKSRILHVNDSPERIARGVAVAWWITFALAPLLGTHIWVALLLAFVFRANKVSMLAFMWVHNPVTMWPILYLNARVGEVVMRLWTSQAGGGIERIKDFLVQWQAEGVITSMVQGDFWKRLMDVMLNVGTEVWIGGAILGALACVGSYYATKYVVILYRRRKQGRRGSSTLAG